MTEVYAITEGYEGPPVAGPYYSYDAACMARDGMKRPWRMVWRRQYYWVQPVDCVEAL